MRTKKEVLESVEKFVGGEDCLPGSDNDMVTSFLSANCSWLEERESLVFPSSWLSEEDLDAVLEEFFVGTPVVSWDGYLFQFDGIGIWESEAVAFCKEGDCKNNLFIFSENLVPVLNKILEKEEDWWQK